jgi:hypothetical protein
MTKTITPNDVIKYLYNETSEEENIDIEVQKICNAEVDECIDDLRFIKQEMEKIEYNPKESTLQSILAYSKRKNQKYQSV